MLSVSWIEGMLTVGFRSFQRGTGDLCWSKGWKVTSCQVGSLKKYLLPGRGWTTCVRPWIETGTIGSSSKFDRLHIWSLLTYWSPQYLLRKICTRFKISSGANVPAALVLRCPWLQSLLFLMKEKVLENLLKISSLS